MTVVLTLVGACSRPAPAPPLPPTSAPLATPVSAPALAGRGQVVDAQRATVPGTGDAQVVVYRSTNGTDGAPTQVSGVFVTPTGAPPAGGWPVIVYAHGTTGLPPECGPTLNLGRVNDFGPVAMLAAKGYAVALIDYQGMGVAGRQQGATAADPTIPYLEPRSAAYDVIDAVRAMQHLHPGQVSSRWAVAGHSQGGQAAWAAAELAPTYGTGLTLVAAMSQAPVLDLRTLGYDDGRIDNDQAWFLPTLITGVADSRPEMNRWNYLRGSVRANLPTLINWCDPAVKAKQTAVESAMTHQELLPATRRDAELLQTALTQYSLPQRRIAVPVYVAQGSKDPLVLPQSTRTAVRQACALGDRVHLTVLVGKGHDIGGDMGGYDWLYDRFAGKPDDAVCSAG
ncbi:lipase family protein [Tsukamurella soli]|uniref:Lipase family protein n=2 Tax=Tsukamurella soli TaxID=644556 RepID=A0ABP8K0S1_9ACTN